MGQTALRRRNHFDMDCGRERSAQLGDVSQLRMTGLAKRFSMPRRLGPRGRSESEQEAGEPSVIYLSFDGEVTNGADQKEPVKKVGLIVNFTQLTVSGFQLLRA